jgi:hypothetical protein
MRGRMRRGQKGRRKQVAVVDTELPTPVLVEKVRRGGERRRERR